MPNDKVILKSDNNLNEWECPNCDQVASPIFNDSYYMMGKSIALTLTLQCQHCGSTFSGDITDIEEYLTPMIVN